MDTAFDKQMAGKRERITKRDADASIPKMSEEVLKDEANLLSYLTANFLLSEVRGGNGTGIFVIKTSKHRIYKLEFTQVGGPT